MKTNRMSCGEVREKLPLYVGGDLDQDVLEAVRGHLDLCRECARQMDRAMGARRVLVSAFRAQEGDVDQPGLWPGIRAKLLVEGRIQAEGEAAVPSLAPRARRARWLWALAPLAAAAVLALLLRLEGEREGGSKIRPGAPGPHPSAPEVVDVPVQLPARGTLERIDPRWVESREVLVVPAGQPLRRGEAFEPSSGGVDLARFRRPFQ